MPGARALIAGAGAFATGVVAAGTLWVQVGHVGDLGARVPPPQQEPACPAPPPSGGDPPPEVGPDAKPDDL